IDAAPVPSSSPTRRIDRPSIPSASSTRSAASTMASLVRGVRALGFGAVRQGGSGTSAVFAQASALSCVMSASVSPAEHYSNLERCLTAERRSCQNAVRTNRTMFCKGWCKVSLIMEARGLNKRFGKTQALDGLDLTAASGQVVALLGPNGAGKTTFIRMVATLLRPDSGELRVGGYDVRRQAAAVRQTIGLAGQFAAIEPAMTGRENLEMVARLFGQNRKTARSNASSVLDTLGLEDAGDRLVRTYSGGMRRRLDLGASLVGGPKLLLLDEPTTGLDPRSRIELWDAIRRLVGQGTDVLLTTQYLDEVFLPLPGQPGASGALETAAS